MSQGGGVRGAQYFNAFHGAIRELYDINPLASETKALAAGEGKFKAVLNAAEKAFKKVYKDGYKPTDLLTVNEFANLITETKAAFDPALEFVQSDVLKSYLDQDVFVFSGLKAHKQLTQARSLLKDDKGAIRPYYQFQQEIVKLNNSYNKLYLEAEYEFAVHSAQSADQWSNLSDDTERYLLQYRTAQDERVREDHQALAGTTLPKDDPFWDSYYPPNGWRCRCVAIEVLAGKYPTSNSAEAIAKGETATTAISKSGGNKLAMFRFNPGKQQVIFPPHHPYYKVQDGVKGIVNGLYEKAKEKDTSYDPHDIGELHKIPEYRQALKSVQYNKLTDKFPNLTEDELASIRYYSIDGYEELNQNLWKGKSIKSTNSLEKVLNTALSKLPKDNNHVYFRGVGLPKDIIDQYEYHWKNDLVKTEKAFTSTSLDAGVAEKMQVTLQNEHRVMFILNGKNGRNITEISHYLDKEKEVLFKSKLQVKVENVELKNGYYEISLTEID